MRKIVQCSIMMCGLVALAGCTSPGAWPDSGIPQQRSAYAAPGTQPPVEWRLVDAGTGQINTSSELEVLADAFPASASVRLRLLGAHIREGDLAAALDQVEWLAARDYAFGAAGQDQLRSLYHGDELDRLEAMLARAPEAVAAGTVVGAVPADIHLPEAVLWDAQQQRMLATAIVSRDLYVFARDAWRAVRLAGAGSLAGIALDEPRGIVWLGSGIVDPTPDPGTAFRGVIAIDRATLAEVRRVAAPAGVTISDIAIGPDGTVYGSDPVQGGIYAAAPTDSEMQVFIAPGTFRSPQGIAVRPDNTALYVSDYRYGLAQVMLRSRQVYRLRASDPVLLDGIDGLWLLGNDLIAVQNGISPMRVTAFTLGPGIGLIASHRTLEIANPAWSEPLGGAISDGALYYIGTGQWDIWREGGVLNDGAATRPSLIHRLQLGESPPDLR